MDTSINGFLFISDITGYTAYLNHSELEHAQDSLKSLLDILIEQTKLPLQISRLEGDAIISYLPEDGYLQGQSLVDMIENTYITFRRALELMVLNTSCKCRACRNLSELDLKFFVHYGEFALHKLESYTELIGNDVNTIHRLTKNTVLEKTGISAYVLYTLAAISALDLPELVNELTTHSDTYEHLGEIQYFIGDMHNLWKQEKGKRKLALDQENAFIKLEFDIPIALSRFWDFFTLPDNFAVIVGANSIKHENLKNGRVQPGSKLICAHGKRVSRFTIVDWQPFDRFTVTTPPYNGALIKTTYILKPDNIGTKLIVLFGKIEGGIVPVNKVMQFVFKRNLLEDSRKKVDFLTEKFNQERNKGDLLDLNQEIISPELINAAVKESLLG